jgi:hypothetical protein
MLSDALAALAGALADTSRPGLYGGLIVADLRVISVAELPWNGAAMQD